MKAKICPICQNIYPTSLTQCPNCNYREPLDGKQALGLALIILIIATIFKCATSDSFFDIISEQKTKFQGEEIHHSQKKLTPISSTIDIPIRPMSNLGELSRNEIYEKRKKYVQKSIIFSNLKNYAPNENVYNVVDFLPWISAYEIAKNGTQDNPNIGEGNSRHSIFVNNPELLMGFIIPEYSSNKNRKDFNEIDYMLPTKITWDEENKTIKAYFDFNTFFNMHPQYRGSEFYVDETNARDLGYNWIFCYAKKKVIFSSVDNISKFPYQMRGYYHRGYACGLENGCNNYSPMQKDMVFKIMNNESFAKFKLWKKKPRFASQKPDLVYEMYFE